MDRVGPAVRFDHREPGRPPDALYSGPHHPRRIAPVQYAVFGDHFLLPAGNGDVSDTHGNAARPARRAPWAARADALVVGSKRHACICTYGGAILNFPFSAGRGRMRKLLWRHQGDFAVVRAETA